MKMHHRQTIEKIEGTIKRYLYKKKSLEQSIESVLYINSNNIKINK